MSDFMAAYAQTVAHPCITCGREQDAQGMAKDATKHMQGAIVDPATVLDSGIRDDLCRCLLWYARCRGDAWEVQQMMNSVQTVLHMQGVAKHEPFVGLIGHHVISSQSIAGAIFGAALLAAVLLCSSWKLVLSLSCVLFGGLFLLFHPQ